MFFTYIWGSSVCRHWFMCLWVRWVQSDAMTGGYVVHFFFSVFVSLPASFLPLCLKIHCIVCCCISPPVGLQSEALHSTAATPPYLAASINADFTRRVFCLSHTPPGSKQLQRLAWVWRPSLVYNAYRRSNSIIQRKARRDCRGRSRTVLALSCLL